MKLSIASAALLSAWCSFLPAARSDPAGSRDAMCWTPAELRGTRDDWKAVKGTPKAFRRPPSRALLPFRAVDPRLRGVIRSVRLPANEKIIALTFDLCEEPYEVSGYDSRVIDYLRDEGVEATFFAGGKWLLTHDVRAQQLLSDPLFEVGNHTWEHRNLRIVSGPVLKSEIESAQAAYEEVRQNFERMDEQHAVDCGIRQRPLVFLDQRRQRRPRRRPTHHALRGRHQRQATLGFFAEQAEIRRRIADTEHALAARIFPARADAAADKAPSDDAEPLGVKVAQVDNVHGC